MGLFLPNSPAFIAAVNFVFSKEGGYHHNPNDLAVKPILALAPGRALLKTLPI